MTMRRTRIAASVAVVLACIVAVNGCKDDTVYVGNANGTSGTGAPGGTGGEPMAGGEPDTGGMSGAPVSMPDAGGARGGHDAESGDDDGGGQSRRDGGFEDRDAELECNCDFDEVCVDGDCV